MFTQDCFLRNVPENIKFSVAVNLMKIGYEPMYMNYANNIGGKNMVCEMQTWHYTDSDNKPDAIDCGTNEELFYAIAALNDETDKHQWFFSTGWSDFDGKPLPDKWIKCDQDSLEKFAFVNNSPNSYSRTMWKKATVDELIEHFK